MTKVYQNVEFDTSAVAVPELVLVAMDENTLTCVKAAARRAQGPEVRGN